MPTEIRTDYRGNPWEIDWELVYSITRSYFLSSYKLKKSKYIIKNKHTSNWINILSGVISPVITGALFFRNLSFVEEHVYETDWKTVIALAESETEKAVREWYCDFSLDPDNMKDHLHLYIDATKRLNENFNREAERATKSTLNKMKSTIKKLERAKKVAEVTRDTSGAILGVGATILSGGAAAGVLAASVGLKGVATYQDTNGSIEATIIEVTQNAIVGMIPLGKQAMVGTAPISAGKKKVLEAVQLFFIEIPSDMAKEMVLADSEQKAKIPFKSVGGPKVAEYAFGEIASPMINAGVNRLNKKFPLAKVLKNILSSPAETITDKETVKRLTDIYSNLVSTNVKKHVFDRIFSTKPSSSDQNNSIRVGPRFHYDQEFISPHTALKRAIKKIYLEQNNRTKMKSS